MTVEALRGNFVVTWVARAVQVPGHERYVALQAARSTLAAVVAWLVVSQWFHFEQAFLAPYVAVFLVEATVIRSARQAVVQVGAVVAGLLLAVVVTRIVASSTVAIGIAVAVGYLIGQWRRFGNNGIWVAITALLVIATGATGSPVLLGERLLETAIGAVIGVAVTALVLPPVYPAGDEATALTRELRDLLREMAEGCRDTASDVRDGWVRRARGIDRLLHRALDESRWAHESVRFNPRPAAAHIRRSAPRWDRTVDDLSYVSSAIEALAHAVEPVAVGEWPRGQQDSCGQQCPRGAVADLLDALADLVDHIGDDAHKEAGRVCEQRVDELERAGEASGDMAVAARLGAVQHTARRILAAVGDR